VKSAVETLSPTRVRLTVEVPFDELEPSVQAAYKKIAGQVRIQGFRPGKVPPPVIDRKIGRAAVLEEAVNEALPVFYGRAVEENSVAVLGRPEVEVTEFADGGQLAFQVEVDVRPDITLPDYNGLEVTVDDAVVSDEEVDEQLGGLRERFATLAGVERPVATGDYVTLDLKSSVDGAEVPGGTATGMSYEVGSGDLVPGLDEQLVGMAADENKEFTTDLAYGDYAGKTATVDVTVRSVREKKVPDLDDDFAQTASEFDTIAELRDDIRTRLQRIRSLEQGVQARDRVLEKLLEAVEVPLPEAVVEAEVEMREHALAHSLQEAGLTKETYLQIENKSVEDFDAEAAASASQAVKAQFVLDALADKEELGITENELSEQIVRRAMRSGLSPDDYLRQVVDSGQLPALAAEVRRGKALATVLEAAVVTDVSGNPVDLTALRPDGGADGDASAESDAETESPAEGDAGSDTTAAE
jgi:trigger factor